MGIWMVLVGEELVGTRLMSLSDAESDILFYFFRVRNLSCVWYQQRDKFAAVFFS